MAKCGNASCAVSSDPFDTLTFGSGRLTMNGYWEKPCATCARAYEERNPGEEVWPFKNQNVEEQAKSIREELDEEDKRWELLYA